MGMRAVLVVVLSAWTVMATGVALDRRASTASDLAVQQLTRLQHLAAGTGVESQLAQAVREIGADMTHEELVAHLRELLRQVKQHSYTVFGDGNSDEWKCSTELRELEDQAHGVLDSLRDAQARHHDAHKEFASLEEQLHLLQQANSSASSSVLFDREVYERRVKHLEEASKTLQGLLDHTNGVIARFEAGGEVAQPGTSDAVPTALLQVAELATVADSAMLARTLRLAAGEGDHSAWREHWYAARDRVTKMRERVLSALARERALSDAAESSAGLQERVEQASERVENARALAEELQAQYDGVRDALRLLREKCSGVKFTETMRERVITSLEQLVEAVSVSGSAQQEFERRMEAIDADLRAAEEAPAMGIDFADGAAELSGASATGATGMASSEDVSPEVQRIMHMEESLEAKARAIHELSVQHAKELHDHLETLRAAAEARAAQSKEEAAAQAKHEAALAEAQHAAEERARQEAEAAAEQAQKEHERAAQAAALTAEAAGAQAEVREAWNELEEQAAEDTASPAGELAEVPATRDLDTAPFEGYTGMTGVEGITGATGNSAAVPLDFAASEDLKARDAALTSAAQALQHEADSFFHREEVRKERLSELRAQAKAAEETADAARNLARQADGARRDADAELQAVTAELQAAEREVASLEAAHEEMHNGQSKLDMEVQIAEKQSELTQLKQREEEARAADEQAVTAAQDAAAEERRLVEAALAVKKEAHELEQALVRAAVEHAEAETSAAHALAEQRQAVVDAGREELAGLEEKFAEARDYAAEVRTAAVEAAKYVAEKELAAQEVVPQLDKAEKGLEVTESLKAELDARHAESRSSNITAANATIVAETAVLETQRAELSEAEAALVAAEERKALADKQLAAVAAGSQLNTTLSPSDEQYLQDAEGELGEAQAQMEAAQTRIDAATSAINLAEGELAAAQEKLEHWTEEVHPVMPEGMETYEELVARLAAEREAVAALQHEVEVRATALKQAEANAADLAQRAHVQEEVARIDSIAVDHAKERVHSLAQAATVAKQTADAAEATLAQLREAEGETQRIAAQGVREAEQAAEGAVAQVTTVSREFEHANAQLTAARIALSEAEADVAFSKSFGQEAHALEVEATLADLRAREQERAARAATLLEQLRAAQDTATQRVNTLEDKLVEESEQRRSAEDRSATDAGVDVDGAREAAAHAVASDLGEGVEPVAPSARHDAARVTEGELTRMRQLLQELQEAAARATLTHERAQFSAQRASSEVALPRLAVVKAERDLQAARADVDGARAGGSEHDLAQAEREAATAGEALNNARALYDTAITSARTLVREEARSRVHREALEAYVNDMQRWVRALLGMQTELQEQAPENLDAARAALGMSATGAASADEGGLVVEEVEDPALAAEESEAEDTSRGAASAERLINDDAEAMDKAFDDERAEYERVGAEAADRQHAYLKEKTQRELELQATLNAIDQAAQDRRRLQSDYSQQAHSALQAAIERFELAAQKMRVTEHHAVNYRAWADDLERAGFEAQVAMVAAEQQVADDAGASSSAATGATGSSAGAGAIVAAASQEEVYAQARAAVERLVSLPGSHEALHGLDTARAHSLEDVITLHQVYDVHDQSVQVRAAAVEAQVLFRRAAAQVYEVQVETIKQAAAHMLAADREAESAAEAARVARVEAAGLMLLATQKAVAAQNVSAEIVMRRHAVTHAQHLVAEGAIVADELANLAQSARERARGAMSLQRDVAKGEREKVQRLAEIAKARAEAAAAAQETATHAARVAAEAVAAAQGAEDRLREVQEVAAKHGASTDGSGNADPADGKHATTLEVEAAHERAQHAVAAARAEESRRDGLLRDARAAEQKASEAANEAANLSHQLAARAEETYRAAVEGRQEAAMASRHAMDEWEALADQETQEAMEAKERLRVAREREAEAVAREAAAKEHAGVTADAARVAAESAHAQLQALVARQTQEQKEAEEEAARAIAAAREARRAADEAEAAAQQARDTEADVRVPGSELDTNGTAPATPCGVSIREAGTCPAWHRLQAAKETAHHAAELVQRLQQETVEDPLVEVEVSPELTAAQAEKAEADARAKEMHDALLGARDRLHELYSQQKQHLQLRVTDEDAQAEREAERTRLLDEVRAAEDEVHALQLEAAEAQWAARNVSSRITDMLMQSHGHRDELARAEEAARVAALAEHDARLELAAAKRGAQAQADKAERASRTWTQVVRMKELVAREEEALRAQRDADEKAHRLEHEALQRADEARVAAHNASVLAHEDLAERRAVEAELARNLTTETRARNSATAQLRIAQAQRIRADAELAVALAKWQTADHNMRDSLAKAKLVAEFAAKWDSAEPTLNLDFPHGLDVASVTGPAGNLLGAFVEGDVQLDGPAPSATGAAFEAFRSQDHGHDLEVAAAEARTAAKAAAEALLARRQELQVAKDLVVRLQHNVTRAHQDVQRAIAMEQERMEMRQEDYMTRVHAAQLVRDALAAAQEARLVAERKRAEAHVLQQAHALAEAGSTDAAIALRRAEVALQGAEESLRVAEERYAQNSAAADALLAAANAQQAREVHLRIAQHQLERTIEAAARLHEAAKQAAEHSREAQIAMVAAVERADALLRHAQQVDAASKEAWEQVSRHEVVSAEAQMHHRRMAQDAAHAAAAERAHEADRAFQSAVDVLKQIATRNLQRVNQLAERASQELARLLSGEGEVRVRAERARNLMRTHQAEVTVARAKVSAAQKQLVAAQKALLSARGKAESGGGYLADVAADEAALVVTRKQKVVAEEKLALDVAQQKIASVRTETAEAEAELAALREGVASARSRFDRLRAKVDAAQAELTHTEATAVDRVTSDLVAMERQAREAQVRAEASAQAKAQTQDGAAHELPSATGIATADAVFIQLADDALEEQQQQPADATGATGVASLEEADQAVPSPAATAGSSEQLEAQLEDDATEEQSTTLSEYELALARVIGRRAALAQAHEMEFAAVLESRKADELALRIRAMHELQLLINTMERTKAHAHALVRRAQDTAALVITHRERTEHASALAQHLDELAELSLKARSQAQAAWSAHKVYTQLVARRDRHAAALGKSTEALASVSHSLEHVEASLSQAKAVLAQSESALKPALESLEHTTKAAAEAEAVADAKSLAARRAETEVAEHQKHVKSLAARYVKAAASYRAASQQHADANEALIEARAAANRAARAAHVALEDVQEKCKFGTRTDAKEIARQMIEKEMSHFDKWLLSETPEHLKEKVQERVRLVLEPCQQANTTATEAVLRAKAAAANEARADALLRETDEDAKTQEALMKRLQQDLATADDQATWAPLRSGAAEAVAAAKTAEAEAGAARARSDAAQKQHAEVEKVLNERRAVVDRLEKVHHDVTHAHVHARAVARSARANFEASAKNADETAKHEAEERDALKESLRKLHERGARGWEQAANIEAATTAFDDMYHGYAHDAAAARAELATRRLTVEADERRMSDLHTEAHTERKRTDAELWAAMKTTADAANEAADRMRATAEEATARSRLPGAPTEVVALARLAMEFAGRARAEARQAQDDLALEQKRLGSNQATAQRLRDAFLAEVQDRDRRERLAKALDAHQDHEAALARARAELAHEQTMQAVEERKRAVAEAEAKREREVATLDAVHEARENAMAIAQTEVERAREEQRKRDLLEIEALQTKLRAAQAELQVASGVVGPSEGEGSAAEGEEEHDVVVAATAIESRAGEIEEVRQAAAQTVQQTGALARFVRATTAVSAQARAQAALSAAATLATRARRATDAVKVASESASWAQQHADADTAKVASSQEKKARTVADELAAQLTAAARSLAGLLGLQQQQPAAAAKDQATFTLSGRHSLDEATALCAAHDARVCTHHDLVMAFARGFESCTCGWTSTSLDNNGAYVVEYPAQAKSSQCADRGIVVCARQNPDAATDKFAVHCCRA